MDFLFELLFELIAEGTVELSKSRRVPKYIRYPLIVVIVLFCVAVIGLVFAVGILSLRQNVLLGILLIALGVFMLVVSILKLKKRM